LKKRDTLRGGDKKRRCRRVEIKRGAETLRNATIPLRGMRWNTDRT